MNDRVVVLLLVLLLLPSASSAEDFDLVTLGQTPVDYVEHRMSINGAGWVSWSEIDEGFPEARVTRDNGATVDLHSSALQPYSFVTNQPGLVPSDFVLSRAEDLTEVTTSSVSGLSVRNPYVVGYVASGRQSVRRAVLWTPVSTPTASGAPTYRAYSLHAAAEAAAGAPQRWTAAYGVASASSSNDDVIYVVGQRRDSLSARSVPVLWTITRIGGIGGAAVTYSVSMVDLDVPGDAELEYGIAYDLEVTSSGTTVEIQVVGGTGSGVTGVQYMEATAWYRRLEAGIVSVNSAQKLADFTRSTFATSVATRIKRGPALGADDTFVVVGSAVDAMSAPVSSSSFSCRIVGTSVTSCDYDTLGQEGPALEGASESLAFGVAANESTGRAPRIVGTATRSTLTTAAIAGTLTGYFSYAGVYTALGAQEKFNDCDVDDSDAGVGNVRAIYDVNDSGAMIARDGSGNAVILRPNRSPFVPIVHVRRSDNRTEDYWWVEMPGFTSTDSSDTPNGGFLYSEFDGCEADVSCGDVSFTLSNEGADAVSDQWQGVYPRTEGAALYVPFSPQRYFPAFFDQTAFFTGRTFNPGRFQSAISFDGSACELTEELETLTYGPFTPSSIAEVQLNPPHDPFGGDWRDCDGDPMNAFETDVEVDTVHCGACNVSCSDGASCDDGVCARVIITEFEYDPPENGQDAEHEWVEIYVSSGTVDVSGWAQLDRSGSGTFPAGLPILQGGQYYVLASCSDVFSARWGFKPDFEALADQSSNSNVKCASDDPTVPNLTLSGPTAVRYDNSGDDVGIEDANGNLISGVSYGNRSGYVPRLADISSGSWALQDLSDEDNAAAWSRDTTPTPGSPNDQFTPLSSPTFQPTAPGRSSSNSRGRR